MANKTVYPYGTEGQLPSSIGLINDLRTGGVNKALTAEQGKIIGNLLTEEQPIDLTSAYKYVWYIDSNNQWYKANNSVQVRCCFIPIGSAVEFFACTANGGYCTFAFLKSDTREEGETPDFATGYGYKFSLAAGESGTFDIPADANYLYLYAQIADGTDITGRYLGLTFGYSKIDKLQQVYSIKPVGSYYPISSSGGIAPTYRGTGVYTTTRFTKVAGGYIGITLDSTRLLTVAEYDEDFSFIGFTNIGEVTAGEKTDFSLAENTRYVKIWAKIDSEFSGDAKTDITIEGDFPADWDTFNPRSSDNGYQRVMVPVRVTDPTCCDEETQTVQDASQILPDYGVICLPEQYSVKGRPTRLIIYCHGAAVNYASNVSRFDSQDLDPTYWLKEGYAVMDIEGNPFNNEDEHLQTPQAMDCYLAAYRWAISYYNIARDGIFLGGRSMGGGTVFTLMRKQCPIPVLAACPNATASLTTGASSAARKAFWALHCGFDIPAGYTFGDGTYTNNDKALFLANWDKLIKNNPGMSLVTDLPVTDEFKEQFIDCYESYSDARVALWKNLHMVVKCPVKFFSCNQDETAPPEYTSEVFYRMLLNAGQITELRLFNSYKDYRGTGTSAHHYDTQDPALRSDITTSYGEELEDVPIVYIEMLAFWRRYEQGL